ncbi:hypothetical protein ACFVU2_17800 [Leifsonia sp. NPDC058194]|uniref:hypothetical protein n=1 Tax=Leifsonia sp. NPDC058194 TaxID=3346374 RepID=UPI0036DC8B80
MRGLLLAVGGALALAAALVVAPVAAGGAAAASEPAARSCSYDLATASLVCVDAGDDLDAAVLAEQHLVVTDPGAGSPAPAVDAASRAAVPAAARATYVQVKLYDDAGYGGAYFQITNSSACNGSTVYQFGPLSSVGWSGRVSSFASASGCTTKLWSGASYSGSSYGFASSASSLGSMNDQANSVSLK